MYYKSQRVFFSKFFPNHQSFMTIPINWFINCSMGHMAVCGVQNGSVNMVPFDVPSSMRRKIRTTLCSLWSLNSFFSIPTRKNNYPSTSPTTLKNDGIGLMWTNGKVNIAWWHYSVFELFQILDNRMNFEGLD